MVIRAYDEDYVAGAQRVLGHALDFAVMTLGIDPDVFGKAFSVSDCSKQFAGGNPAYVAGMNGCELAREVLLETNTPFEDAEDVMFIDRSPEYWAGWVLAFFQWYSNLSFLEILSAVSLEGIVEMYPIYHETDIMRFVDFMQEKLSEVSPQTRLRIRREACHLSQSELARISKVPLRQIQLFEQRQRDINKTSAETLFRLAKYLHCEMADLMEPYGHP